METSNIIMIVIFGIILFAFVTVEIHEPKQRFPKYDPPKPPLNPDKTFLKAVDDCVKQIEAERLEKRKQVQEKLYCFQCEIDTTVSNHNGNKYCKNCGLIHKNNYHD